MEITYNNYVVRTGSIVDNSDIFLKKSELIVNTIHVSEYIMNSHLSSIYN